MLLTIPPNNLVIITLCGVNAMIEKLVKRSSWVQVIDVCVDQKLVTGCVTLGFAPRASSLYSLGHA